MRYQTRLAILIALGLVIRVCFAFTTKGLSFDLQSYALVDNALHASPSHVYALVNTPSAFRWPYLPGYFPLILLSGTLAAHVGLSFTSLIRLPAVIADLGLAWVVQDYLRDRTPERIRLVAAGSIALGPLFIAISSFNGQIDALAILPAVIAVALWERLSVRRRAVFAGLLIGIGTAIKTFPLLTVLALFSSCTSRREATVLVASAVLVPLVASAAWLLSDAHAVIAALKYHSLAGQGGVSLIAQPDLAGTWLGGPYHHFTGLSAALQGRLGTIILILALCAATLAALRSRTGVSEAATLIWLAVFAFGINFSPRYAIWGIPFFLMAGQVWKSVALQAILIVPIVLLLAAPFSDHRIIYIYVPLMLVAWLAYTGAGLRLGAALVLRRPPHRAAIS